MSVIYRRHRKFSFGVTLIAAVLAGCSGSGGGAPGTPGTPAPPNPFEISNPSLTALNSDEDVAIQNAVVTTNHRTHTEYQRQGQYQAANFHFAHGAELNGEDTTVSIVSGAFNTRHAELRDKTQDAAQGGLTFRQEDGARAFVNIIQPDINGLVRGFPSVNNPFPFAGANNLEEFEEIVRNLQGISDDEKNGFIADYTGRQERYEDEVVYLALHNLAFNTEDLPLKDDGTNIAVLIAGRDIGFDENTGEQNRGDLDI